MISINSKMVSALCVVFECMLKQLVLISISAISRISLHHKSCWLFWTYIVDC